ncbi:penicillin-binding transpeptidase domain-containing protein [Sedimentisphaera salicampi]|uniref:penicillin-binding transpeptidase domain-containing protein n=1 Tax=Sedimentisphaera salicampi TaxID=1941349 RepID=UPI000B9BB5B0|nr:penicillin-binding transpeptidase domain-containing protein [Sedimentisphaera salicampi]OXU14522.1 Beta-lactam-inducible penicillin-binding protein [Sedimentisphaera salicampi]
MYEGRIKFIVAVFIFLLCITAARLVNLQLVHCEATRDQISRTGVKSARVLPTVRGSITDRFGEKLAVDSPVFQLMIRYELSRLLDERFWLANAIVRSEDKGIGLEEAREYWENQLASDIELLDTILEYAEKFSPASLEEIKQEISQINDRMWRLRRYFAWRRNFPNSSSISDFDSLPQRERLAKEAFVNDLWEMKNKWFAVADISQDKIYHAQNTLSSNPEVKISTRGRRKYPYGKTASQIIGWVNPSQPDKELFKNDELIRYKEKEVAGFAGTERICEPFLRGRRGKIVYTKRDRPPKEKAREFGDNVRLTLDIKLQEKIEKLLKDPLRNPNSDKICNAVVIDARNSEILAAVSQPGFNLQNARQNYNQIISDPNKPSVNKAFEKLYPPGSTIKPLILAAALEEGEVGIDETISCSLPADENWPRCWLQRLGSCHDYQFEGEGGNNGRNAIRGSCNVYFTKAAHRLEPRKLQKHLFAAGFGREILCPIDFSLVGWKVENMPSEDRNLPESRGIIWSGYNTPEGTSFEGIPPLSNGEKRWFGMGQGNLRVSLLQIANLYASIARGGVFERPVIYSNISEPPRKQDLGWSEATVKNVEKGLWMVVNKIHGTAYKQFKGSELMELDVEIYGKTGSTQNPENALFAGYIEAENSTVAIAVIVEGGQSGARDGAPLGRELFKVIEECGYFD